MEKIAKILGKKIREKRKSAGFSQDAFALTCDIDRSYMGRIERGEANLTVEKLYRLSKVLGCEPSSLLPQLEELQ